MGQTLTHGIYLPDEGERNCYSGLAANWQILDGSVGTIAAHTAALAGKAPLVHTHTKSQITDFPAYGATAGTICEGNDSRLSDARTPLSHTHTKANITDLLNSDFIPSANNSYNLGTSANKWKSFNGINPGALSLPDRFASFNLDITNWDKRAANGFISSITASVGGWINVQIQRDVDFSVWVIGSYRQLFRAGQMPNNGKYAVMVLFPIDKDHTVNLYTLALDASESDLVFGVYKFFPCLGNV